MGNGSKMRYYVLFTQTLKQWDVTETIRKTLPKGRGTVFYPCVELWMGSLGQTVVEALFPGYVFIRSDMNQNEMSDFIRDCRREVHSFIKELHIGEGRTGGAARVTSVDGEDDTLNALNDNEAELLDFMLGFPTESVERQHFGEESDAAGNGTEAGQRNCRRKLPSAGAVGMSYGFQEKDGRYVVMEGPLKGHEDRIVDVNLRDRRAYLNLKVGGRLARVGFTIRGKKYWFPENRAASNVLEDGTVVNCHDVAAAMMRHMSKKSGF